MHEHIGMSTSLEEEISAKPSSHFWSYYKYCVSLQRVILHRRIGISCLLGNFGIKNIVYLKNSVYKATWYIYVLMWYQYFVFQSVGSFFPFILPPTPKKVQNITQVMVSLITLAFPFYVFQIWTNLYNAFMGLSFDGCVSTLWNFTFNFFIFSLSSLRFFLFYLVEQDKVEMCN